MMNRAPKIARIAMIQVLMIGVGLIVVLAAPLSNIYASTSPEFTIWDAFYFIFFQIPQGSYLPILFSLLACLWYVTYTREWLYFNQRKESAKTWDGFCREYDQLKALWCTLALMMNRMCRLEDLPEDLKEKIIFNIFRRIYLYGREANALKEGLLCSAQAHYVKKFKESLIADPMVNQAIREAVEILSVPLRQDIPEDLIREIIGIARTRRWFKFIIPCILFMAIGIAMLLRLQLNFF